MWFTVIPAVIVAALCLILPGLMALAATRVSWGARLALAPVVGVASIAVGGLLSGMLGGGYSVLPVLVLPLALLAVGYFVGRRARTAGDSRTRRPLRESLARYWPAALAWFVAAVGIAVVAFAGVGAPEQFPQTYDNTFHLSAVARILETGDASSLHLRTMIETARPWAVYPAAWHGLVVLVVQLTGAGIPLAANAAWLAVAAVVWLPGVAWLSHVVLRGRRGAGIVALLIGGAFGAFPYALIPWGTLYPTFLAHALLPAALAALVLTIRGFVDRWTIGVHAVGGRIGAPWGALAVSVLAMFAVGFSQPRVLPSLAVLVFPLLVAESVRLARYWWARGGVARRRTAVIVGAGIGVVVLLVAVATIVVLEMFDVAERPIAEHLNGPQALAMQSIGEGLWQVLTQQWLVGSGVQATFPAILLAVSVIVGTIVALRSPRLRWIAASYLLAALLFVFAAGSDADIVKIATGLWYKDRFRLSSLIPVIGVPLAALGILWAGSWARHARRPWVRIAASSPAIAVVVAITSALALGLGGMTASVAHTMRLPADGKDGVLVDRAQIAFLESLPDHVPAGQLVLGDPWDGSSLSGVFGGREAVFPHVNGQWDEHRLALAWRAQDLATDPTVCEAFRALNVEYVLYNPFESNGGDPAGNHFPAVHEAVEAGLFTLVTSDGVNELYRVEDCG